MPDPYIALVEDTCWHPVLVEGDRLVISKTDPIHPGDFVSIIVWPKDIPPDASQALVKRYLGMGDVRGEPVIWCDMINPKVVFPVPERVIHAVHRVTALIKSSDGPNARPQPLPRLPLTT